jgi:hypothetical protein
LPYRLSEVRSNNRARVMVMHNEKISPNVNNNDRGNNSQTLTFGAWTISVSRKSKSLSIKTTEYHADPLVISRDELISVARLLGLKVRKRSRKRNPNNNIA